MLKVSTASEDSDDKVKETELSPTNLSKHFSSTGDYDKQLALHTSSRTADESIVTLGSELPENENEICALCSGLQPNLSGPGHQRVGW